jgi:hypothetical protein
MHIHGSIVRAHILSVSVSLSTLTQTMFPLVTLVDYQLNYGPFSYSQVGVHKIEVNLNNIHGIPSTHPFNLNVTNFPPNLTENIPI